jgi:microsomal epoxide hydrolase
MAGASPPAKALRVEPFRISVPDAAIEDLRTRLSRARWPDQLDHTTWE